MEFVYWYSTKQHRFLHLKSLYTGKYTDFLRPGAKKAAALSCGGSFSETFRFYLTYF